MLVRSVLLFLALLLVVAAVASIVAPPGTTQSTTATTATAQALPAAPPPLISGVTHVLPREKDVRVQSGELVRLQVLSPTADTADILGLGVSVPVGPGTDGIVSFVAGEPGHYAVDYEVSGASAGEITITP